jgi:hypothetical protein
MDAVLQELGAVECLVWWSPESSVNDIKYNQASDGRCAIAHEWTPEGWLQLVSYFEDYVAQERLTADSFEYFEDVTIDEVDPEGNPYTHTVTAYDQWRASWQEATS